MTTSPASVTVAHSLSVVLADTYTLYLKTQNYHWNVFGPHFPQLHTLFETQYNELAAAVDGIAERIRAIGFATPGSFTEFTKLKTLAEAETHAPEGLQMVQNLANDHKHITVTIKKALSEAQNAGDEATVDLMVQRLQAHDKTAWMLGAITTQKGDQSLLKVA